MTAEGLTEYQLSQSNATGAVDKGRITLTELRRWLLAEIGSRLPSGVPVMAKFTARHSQRTGQRVGGALDAAGAV